MGINNVQGDAITSVVDVLGNSISNAYNCNGDLIYSGTSGVPDYDSYTSELLLDKSSSIYYQDIAIFQNRVFQFGANGAFTSFNARTGTSMGGGNGTMGHAGSAQFNKSWFPENADFPVVYLTDSEHPIMIYATSLSNISTVLKTYSIPDGYGNAGVACFDFSNNIMYCILHEQTETPYVHEIISKWDLSNTTVSDGIEYPTYISSITINSIGVLQGAKYRNGKLFIGINDSQNGSKPTIVVIDALTGVVEHRIVVANVTTEMEGMDFINDFEVIAALQHETYYHITFNAQSN